MLHIVKQYRKMVLSFLENRLDSSDPSAIFTAIDGNKNGKVHKIEMREFLKKENAKISAQIKTIVSEIENNLTMRDLQGRDAFIQRFNELKSKQENESEKLKTSKTDSMAAITTMTGEEVGALHDALPFVSIEKQKVTPVDITVDNVDATSIKENLDYNATLDLLSDLNSDNDLDDQNVLDEKNLRTTISQLSNGDKSKLLSIYENVTGKKVQEINKDNVADFHENFVFNIRFMQGLGYSGGAHALLSGKMEDFAKKVPRGTKLEVSNFDKLSPGVQNAIGALVSTGVLVLTQGVVAASREVKQYDGNELVERIEKSNEGESLSGLKKFLTYIKDAFIGRRLSFSIGEDDTINVRKFEEAITKFATGVLELKFDGTDENLPEGLIKEKYNEILKLSKQFKLDITNPEDKKLLQGILIQDFILSEGTKRQGTDWKFTLGLLFIGFHSDEVSVETVPLELNEQQAEVERELTRKPLDSKTLERIGIKVNKLTDGNFEHTLPKEGSMIRLPGDDRDFPIKEINPKGLNRNDLLSSDVKYNFHFSFVGGRGKDYYVLTLNPSASTSSGATGDIGPQGISDVINLRQGEDLNTKKLNEKVKDSIIFGEALYSIGHDVKFGKLVKLISSGDKEGVRSELTRLSELKGQVNTNKLARSLLSNIDNFAEWDSYMSGNKDTRKEKSPKFDKVRSQKVIKAEVALAGASGFPVPGSENDFRVPLEYKSKQISEVLSGQEITSVQFMTPLDRNNKQQSRASLHRVSVVDGSFAISEKFQMVTDATRKQSIVEGLLKSSHESRAIQNQLKKLNTFLGDKGNVTLEQYKSYLVSGRIDDLGVKGLKLQTGKKTRFLEARAMVAGNVCLNATYAIAYPAFEFEGGNKQKVDSVSSVDYTAATNIELSEGKESGIGFSTPGLINKSVNKGGGKNSGSFGSKPGENKVPNGAALDSVGSTGQSGTASVSGGIG